MSSRARLAKGKMQEEMGPALRTGGPRTLSLVRGDPRGVQARASLERALAFAGPDERTALEVLEGALDLEVSLRHRELSQAMAKAKA